MLGPRRVTRRGRRPVTGRVIVVALCLVGILVLITVLAHSPIFAISRVAIVGDPSGKVTSQITDLVQNQNIFLFNESHARLEIQKNPLVKEVKFTKSLPNSMTVTVTFRDPAFSWQGKNGTFLVDDSGFIFQSGSGTSIPIVISQDKLELGKSIPSSTVSKVSAIATGTKPFLVSISVQPDAYLVVIKGDITATFDPTGDLSSQSQALQLIIAKAKIDGKLPRTVDLRFPKPVVTY